MTGRVIQGSFSGGRPKLAAAQPRTAPPPIQARTIARPPGPPATAFAVRSPGLVAPAFSGRPPAAPGFAGQQGIVQRHGAGGAFAVEAGPLGLISSGGRPLPEAVRGKMEAALGADFSNVRVHVGPQAERIGAIAFTVGSDIYFAPGRYQPDSIQGQQLLGHELAHVVQQRAGRVRNPLGSGLAVVQDHALEAEADRMGQRAAMHRVAAQAKLAPSTAQPSAPVRISPPVNAGAGSYRLSAGAGGREIGSIMVHTRDRGAVEVTDLGVDAAQRGNGVGRMLVAAAARTGLQSGRSKVTLAAQDRGTGHLTRWYREMGFTQIGVNRHGYAQLEAPISRLVASTARPTSFALQSKVVTKPIRFGSSLAGQRKETQLGTLVPTQWVSRLWPGIVQKMEESPGFKGITYQTHDKKITPEMREEINRRYFKITGEVGISAHGKGAGGSKLNAGTEKNTETLNEIIREVKAEFKARRRLERGQKKHEKDDSEWEAEQERQRKFQHYGKTNTLKKEKKKRNNNTAEMSEHEKYHREWHNGNDICPTCGRFGNDKPYEFKY